MKVYVLNKHDNPLMPCTPRKARILLRDKKAKVIKKYPFTIWIKWWVYVGLYCTLDLIPPRG